MLLGREGWSLTQFLIVLYLRLFYTEKYLGWNSEEWPTYVRYSTVVLSVTASALLVARYFVVPLKHQISNKLILTICGIFLPLCIILFFAAGRVTVFPLPQGVNEMNNFGCCSQGLIFSRTMAQNMIDWYEIKKEGFVDMLTEQYGNDFDYPRWAMTPSVLQHIGRKTSKDDGSQANTRGKRSEAETIWNFAFEQFDATVLRREHLDIRSKNLTSTETLDSPAKRRRAR
jgi:hypothetical protein